MAQDGIRYSALQMLVSEPSAQDGKSIAGASEATQSTSGKAPSLRHNMNVCCSKRWLSMAIWFNLVLSLLICVVFACIIWSLHKEIQSIKVLLNHQSYAGGFISTQEMAGKTEKAEMAEGTYSRAELIELYHVQENITSLLKALEEQMRLDRQSCQLSIELLSSYCQNCTQATQSVVLDISIAYDAISKLNQTTNEIISQLRHNSSVARTAETGNCNDVAKIINGTNDSSAGKSGEGSKEHLHSIIEDMNQRMQAVNKSMVDMVLKLDEYTMKPYGTAYNRWGKRSCPAGSQHIYSGRVTGSTQGSNHVGSGVNYLCMPSIPEYNKYDPSGDDKGYSWVAGILFSTYDLGIFNPATHNRLVLCSVCFIRRTSTMMIPARRTCPDNWTKEYEGYLMSSNYAETKTEYVCVDEIPDLDENVYNQVTTTKMNFVSGACYSTLAGVGNCPPFIHSRELTCVVCSQ